MSASGASSSRHKVNLRSTAVKRIMQEASELADPDDDDFVASPLENDIFEWHCTMRGVPDSDYEGGLYHLRILLPHNYPMAAPDIILLTPNGRFELGKKICIDGLTSFHAGSWQPAWGVRTALTGLRSFWMQGGEALSAIGALDCPKEERRRLAKLSRDWKCTTCDLRNHEQFPRETGASDMGDERHSERQPAPSDTTTVVEKNIEGDRAVQPETEAEESSASRVDSTANLGTADTPLNERETGSVRSPFEPSETTSMAPPPRPVPKWIDIPLGLLVALLGILLVRRIM